MRFSCGPHCTHGNTALAIFGQNCSFDMIIAHLGHLSVLCVVVVTISQYGIGFSNAHPAISHAICDISAINTAHTLSEISLNLFQSRFLEYALNHAMIIFGLFSIASLSTSCISMILFLFFLSI